MPMDLSRSLLWVILPGWVAVFPWLLAIGQVSPEVKSGYSSYESLYHAAAFSMVIVVGSLCQAVAGYIEAALDSSLERAGTVAVKEEWLNYLSSQVQPEPVGFRYISRAVTTLKYELAMITAVPASLVGSAVFLAKKVGWQLDGAVFAALLLSIPAMWAFHKQAKDTHFEINRVRAELNSRLKLLRAND